MRPKKPPAGGAHSVVKMLDHLQDQHHMPDYVLGQKAGLSPAVFGEWRRGETPKLLNLEAALNVFGFTLKAVPK